MMHAHIKALRAVGHAIGDQVPVEVSPGNPGNLADVAHVVLSGLATACLQAAADLEAQTEKLEAPMRG